MAESAGPSRHHNQNSTVQNSPTSIEYSMDIENSPNVTVEKSMDLSKDISQVQIRNHPYNYPSHSSSTTSLPTTSSLIGLKKFSFKSINDLAQVGLQIINLDFLDISPPPGLLVCMDCKYGIPPKSALEHIKTHHITISSQDKACFANTIETELCVDSKQKLAFPPKLSPPLAGLKVSKGWGCKLCSYCSITSGTFRTHFMDNHLNKLGSQASQMQEINVQQYFQRTPCFEITPSLAHLEKNNLYKLYLQDFSPTLTTSHLLPPPTSVNEVSPLLRMMQWHEHLKDFIGTKVKVEAMKSLFKLPTANHGNQILGKPLGFLINKYLKNIRTQANAATLGIKCLLMECPR